MSPVSSPVVSPTPGIPGPNPFPISQWQPHFPPNFHRLEHGNKLLQSRTNLFLEMHPNGPRGYDRRTEYCILSIIIMSVQSSMLGDWSDGSVHNGGKTKDAKHIIKGNLTGMYLCMNNQSVVYHSPNFTESECAFTNEENQKDLSHSYFRYSPDGKRRWFLGLNRDGTIRCGNGTRQGQPSAQFHHVTVSSNKHEFSESPPYKNPRKNECCGKQCPRKRKGPRCRTFKKWCKKHRRRFFSLKLKDLKRYYRRCIKKDTKQKTRCVGKKT